MHPAILAGLTALAVSAGLTAVAKRVAVRLRLVAQPHADRWHRERVPMLGGAAIAVGLLGTTSVFQAWSAELLWLLGGAVTLGLVGLWDDVTPLKPQTKLIWQILVASILAAAGLQLRLSGYATLDVFLTLFWIVGITNAINLLDNMDGLAAGIVAIAVAFRLAFLVMDGSGDSAAALFAAIALGSVLGFLLHNFPPASVFMGDAGSLFLGVLVSGLSLVGGFPYSRNLTSVLLFPVLLLLVPIFDTALVTLSRVLAGRSPATGGRDHTSHRLVALGMTERQAVTVLYAVAVTSGLVAFLAYRFGLSATVVLVAFVAIGVVLLGIHLSRLQVYPESEAPLAPDSRFFSLITNFSFKRQVATVLLDVVLVVLAYYSAYLLRFEGGVAGELSRFTTSLPIVIAWQVAGLAMRGAYGGVWRHTGLRDVVALLQGGVIGTVGAVLTLLALYRFEGYSRGVFAIHLALLLLMLAVTRLSFRALSELLPSDDAESVPVAVYGAGQGGVIVLGELARNRAVGRRAVALLDDDRAKHGSRIGGVKVVGGLERLDYVITELGVLEVVVSTDKLSPETLERLVTVARLLGVAVVRAALRFEPVVHFGRTAAERLDD